MIKINNKSDIAILEVTGDIVANDYNFLKDDFDITTPIEVKNFFKENPNKEIQININSGGGDVFAGTAISNMIKNHKGKTTAHIESLAASIASVIAMSCDVIKMPKNSYLMIHKPSTYVYGNVFDFEKTIELLNKIQSNIEDVYMTKAISTIKKENIKNLVDEETWLTGEEAIKYFNIELIDDIEVLNCSTNIRYEKIPSCFKNIKNKKVEIPKELKQRIENLKKM